MFDVTFLIPDYTEDSETTTPPDPYETMPDLERERLDIELYDMIDAEVFEAD
jgi:hypothetical protein